MGILQARMLKLVVISFSRRSSQPRDRTWISCIAGRRFTIWAVKRKPPSTFTYSKKKTEIFGQTIESLWGTHLWLYNWMLLRTAARESANPGGRGLSQRRCYDWQLQQLDAGGWCGKCLKNRECIWTAHCWSMELFLWWNSYLWGGQKKATWTQSCPTLWDPVDCSPPGSSVHGILQAGILEWVAISSSRGSSRPKDQDSLLYEPTGKPRLLDSGLPQTLNLLK